MLFTCPSPPVLPALRLFFPFFDFTQICGKWREGRERHKVCTVNSLFVLWEGRNWNSIGKCLPKSYNAYFFKLWERKWVQIFLKRSLLNLEIPGTQMNLVLSPHAAEKKCIKAREAIWCDKTNPTELYSPGLKCLVILDPQSRSEIQKTASADQKPLTGTSPVAQWLRICLPMQGTWVWSLVREDPTCWGATKHMPQLLSLRSRACEPPLPNPAHPRARAPRLLSPCAATAEARAPKACALQQEKPLQWEARAPQWRVAPTCHN